MTKDELRDWIAARRMTRQRAADALGLSIFTLYRQLSGHTPVSRQTALIAGLLPKPACAGPPSA